MLSGFSYCRSQLFGYHAYIVRLLILQGQIILILCTHCPDSHITGADYLDWTTGSDRADNVVPPGGQYTYVWEVTPNFAPTAGDPNCIPWGYHSHFRAAPEINAGLIGLLITCKPGKNVNFLFHNFSDLRHMLRQYAFKDTKHFEALPLEVF